MRVGVVAFVVVAFVVVVVVVMVVVVVVVVVSGLLFVICSLLLFLFLTCDHALLAHVRNDLKGNRSH